MKSAFLEVIIKHFVFVFCFLFCFFVFDWQHHGFDEQALGMN
jgi:hypothetical protein